MRIFILLFSLTLLFTPFLSAKEKVINWMYCPKEVVEIETTIEINYFDYDRIPELHERFPVDVKPKVVYQPNLEYHVKHIDSALSLNVWLSVLLNKEGKVIKSNFEIPSEDSIFNNMIINSASEFMFTPAILDGQPIFYWMGWKINFKTQLINMKQAGRITIDFDDYLPSPDVYFYVGYKSKILKEFIPEYPRIAKQAGIQGTVWIKVLIDKKGDVLKAQISQSSGTKVLDQAALDVAYVNKFRPASHDGKPIAMWVTYSVGFYIDSYRYKDKN